MKITFLLFTLTHFLIADLGNRYQVDDEVQVPVALKKYIPKGFEALEMAKGDLNRDAYPDVILILKKRGEEKTSDVNDHPEKRPLLILLGQADKSYKLAARSDNSVYCVDCGGQMGDPFTGVTIKNGYFSVEHYGGSGQRWTRIVTFKYSPAEKNWFLFKDGGERFHATAPEELKTEVKTAKNFGKISFQQFDIYKEEK
ncbi:hypothetical protein EV200_106212 [Pedobacter psychrotolerans]|uniref:VCBS repeat protein n=1 Tax=Pedobacter psychrotolerans TaxID=1843235 RepID=A0A4R2H9U7_9SPHI|nr:hypothetical protein [Pedobacter psychrotolerans]TCO22570.1 hypothetical protein EV200_106212 [Pedobacter psychrotolerans]GGE65577.1 hypothetical protein GCM10011413_35050 [Pedobacter psychrotolerans]